MASINPSETTDREERVKAIKQALVAELRRRGRRIDDKDLSSLYEGQIREIDGYNIHLQIESYSNYNWRINKTNSGIKISFVAGVGSRDNPTQIYREPKRGFNIPLVAKKIIEYLDRKRDSLREAKTKAEKIRETEETIKLLKEEFDKKLEIGGFRRVNIYRKRYSGDGLVIEISGLNRQQARDLLNFLYHETIYSETPEKPKGSS